MAFDVTLVGRGCEALPYAVLAVRHLGVEGFGPTRQQFRLRRIATRELAPRVIFDSSSPVVHNVAPTPAPAATRRDRSPGKRTYRFVTPTILKSGGRVESVPTYATLVKRTRDRVNALSTFFGAGPLDWPFKEIGEKAEHVTTATAAGGRVRHGRFSSRQRQVHDLSGFVGEVTYAGPEEALREFDPLLLLLDEIHVGKGAALGNGWVQEIAPASP
jgi:hypothetical protein